MRNILYREAVVALLWASTITRPDIADAFRSVERCCENPGQAHLKAVVKILEHLRGTSEVRVTYDGKDEHDEILA